MTKEEWILSWRAFVDGKPILPGLGWWICCGLWKTIRQNNKGTHWTLSTTFCNPQLESPKYPWRVDISKLLKMNRETAPKFFFRNSNNRIIGGVAKDSFEQWGRFLGKTYWRIFQIRNFGFGWDRVQTCSGEYITMNWMALKQRANSHWMIGTNNEHLNTEWKRFSVGLELVNQCHLSKGRPKADYYCWDVPQGWIEERLLN